MRLKIILPLLFGLLGLGCIGRAQPAIVISPSGADLIVDSARGLPISVFQYGSTDTLALMGWKNSFSLNAGLGAFSEMAVLNNSPLQTIRQAGKVESVTFRIGQKPAGATSLRVAVWRWTGATHHRVGETENLLPRLTSNALNELRLASPIDSVLIGDQVGFSYAGSDGIDWLDVSLNHGSSVVADSGITPGANFDFTNSAQVYGVPNVVFPIGIGMKAPWGVSISNSIFDGVPLNYSHLDATSGTDRANCLPCLLTDSLGVPVANHGKSGNQTYAMLARFGTDVEEYHPKVVFFEGGHNDLTGYDIDVVQNGRLKYAAQVIPNIEDMVDRTVAFGGIFVYTDILPSSQLNTNQRCLSRDSINAVVGQYVLDHGGYVVHTANAFGQFRSGGPAGNKWDINPTYYDVADGGVHMNHLGAQLLFSLVAAVARPVLALTGY